MNNNTFSNSIIQEDMEDIFQRNIAWNELQGATFLVTGATGMLASYLIFYLLFLKEVKNVNIKIIAGIRSLEKAQHIFGEFCDKEDYFRLCKIDFMHEIEIDEKIDYVIHAASLASPQHYSVRPVEVAEPNAIGTYYLLKWANKIQCKKFLYFSTGDVYGKTEAGNSIYEDTLGYIDPLSIHSCYNESKRMGENWCKIFSHEYGVSTGIARIWHTYAPTMDIENDPRVFASFVKSAVEGQDIVMLSDGTATRTFCYITDAIAAFFLILLKGNSGEAYNVCNTRETYSIYKLAKIIVQLNLDKTISVARKERNSEDPYLENPTYGQCIPQNDKLKDLGWECRIDCREGFGRVIRKIKEDRKE